MKQSTLKDNQEKSFVLVPTGKYAFIKSTFFSLLLIGILVLYFYFPQYPIYYLTIIPAVIIIYNYLFIKFTRYEITSSQIKYSRGIFFFKVDYLELYRIKDFEVSQSLPMRFLGIMNLVISTSDKSHPILKLSGIPNSNIPDVIRDLVERARRRNRVFEVD